MIRMFGDVVRGFSLVRTTLKGRTTKRGRALQRQKVIASLPLLSLRAKRGNLRESQNSKIKMQNDRAKVKKQSV